MEDAHMKRYAPALILILAGQVLTVRNVSAQSVGLFDSTNSANRFNAFVFNNATIGGNGGGDSENAVAVGNTLSVGTFNFDLSSVGSLTNAPGTLNSIAAYVGGAFNITGTASFNHGGNVYAASTNQDVSKQNPKVNLNDGGKFYAGSSYVNPSVFTNEASYASSLSTTLDSLAPTLTGNANYSSNVTLPGYQQGQPISNIQIDASKNTTTKNGNTIGFVTLSGSFLSGFSNAPTISVSNMASNESLIINVVGNLTSDNFQLTGATNSHIVWNFAKATEIDVNQRIFEGSILAPNATVNQTLGNIEGTLIAKNWNDSNSQELHQNNEFTGNFAPVFSGLTIPEPAFYQMGVFLACGGFLAFRRRRSAH